jgi:hypothetical protein
MGDKLPAEAEAFLNPMNIPDALEETIRNAKTFERTFVVLIDPGDEMCFSMELEMGLKVNYGFTVRSRSHLNQDCKKAFSIFKHSL